MSRGQMTFGGFCWRRAPASLSVQHTRQVREQQLPYYGSLLQDLGSRAVQVTCEGVFVGEDALEQFQALAAQQTQGTRLLRLPGLPPMMAKLTKLELIGKAEPEKTGYRASFLEDSAAGLPDAAKRTSGMTVAKEGESLWHIANRCHTTAERLLAENPQICWMGALSEGTAVMLP